MIESISITNLASYPKDKAEELTGLSQFNYLYGANGTGKSTIGRVIADEEGHQTCEVKWKGGIKLPTMVYNSDFVERNFTQSAELRGVFTLGEEQSDTIANIATAKTELDKLNGDINKLTQTLVGDNGSEGKKGELVELESSFENKCWAQKKKHDPKLKGAFEGCRSKAANFKAKVLHEQLSIKAPLQSQANLEKKAEEVFGQTPNSEDTIAAIDASKLIEHESNPILKKRVIGKEDVDITAMIAKLGNSDWVLEGRQYHDRNDGNCPFCQQATSEAFAHSLNSYFDETFVADCAAIDALAQSYESEAVIFKQQISETLNAPSKYLNVKGLKSQVDLLEAKFTINRERFEAKKKEAGHAIELESLNAIFDAIKSIIDSANTQIADHNKMVTNISAERKALTAQVWRFVLEELNTDLAEYEKKKGNLEKAITSIQGNLENTKTDRNNKVAEIIVLERQTTSVLPTIEGINRLLVSFGFTGFRLEGSTDRKSYKLVRADGTDAKTTLSEGEKTFVTFLYFFHLLKGSETSSGMTEDRIVVFDDPISSLDSDILFIVGSLIKGLFDEIRSKRSI